MVAGVSDIILATSFFLKNDAKQIEKMRPYAPLGTLQVAASLQNLGYSVSVFDAMLSDGEEEFLKLLQKENPKILALYEDEFNFLNKMCLTHSREAGLRMSKAAQEIGATVIAAGADVSDEPSAYLGNGIDYALIGEADETLCELVDALAGRNDKDPKTIPGLVMLGTTSGEALHRSKQRPPQKRADVFPMAAWEHYNVERYRQAWTDAHGYFSVNMVTTRGCPFHCNWCAKPIWGQHYAMRSPARVAEELAHVKKTIQPDHIWFADDIFGLQPKWVAEFAVEVEARDASIPFMIQSRIDLMTDKAVAGLARAGCAEVWLGVESGSQKILDAMDKGTKLPDISIVREKLRQAGIKACFFLQFGYPGETFDDIISTIELVRELLPDDIGISISYPLRGTKFYDRVKAGLGEKEHWDSSDELAMMFYGPYRTPFYRTLHKLLHRDLELRQKIGKSNELDAADREIFERLEADWLEWRESEAFYRNDDATVLQEGGTPIEAPVLKEVSY
jgi:anaerobic magnesium-protoporphyrin IX monomethyl ester cyclase